jgi:hypothetical protein
VITFVETVPGVFARAIHPNSSVRI